MSSFLPSMFSAFFLMVGGLAVGKINPPTELKLEKDRELNSELTFIPKPGKERPDYRLGPIPVRRGTIEMWWPGFTETPKVNETEKWFKKGYLARGILSQKFVIGGLEFPPGTELSFSPPSAHSDDGPDFYVRQPWGTFKLGKLQFKVRQPGKKVEITKMLEGAVGVNAFTRDHGGSWSKQNRIEISGTPTESYEIAGFPLVKEKVAVISGRPLGYRLVATRVRQGELAKDYTLKTLKRSIPLRAGDLIRIHRGTETPFIRAEWKGVRKVKGLDEDKDIFETSGIAYWNLDTGLPLQLGGVRGKQIHGLKIKDKSLIYFYKTGQVRSVIPAADQKVQGIAIHALRGAQVSFWESGKLAQVTTKDKNYVKGQKLEGKPAENFLVSVALMLSPSGKLRLLRANYVNHGTRVYIVTGEGEKGKLKEINYRDKTANIRADWRMVARASRWNYLDDLVRAWLREE